MSFRDPVIPAAPDRIGRSMNAMVRRVEMVSPQGDAPGIAVVGDPLRRLFDEQYLPMVRLAGLLLGSTVAAEDVVQEAFVAVDKKLAGLPADAHAAYLRRAVVNGARSSMRRAGALKRTAIPQRDFVTEPVDVVVRGDQQQAVLVALDGLPGRQRECLVLRYYANLTDNEIAEHLDLSPGSVKTHLRRGLDALQTSLGGLR